MKPAPFDYLAPRSLEEALHALTASDREVKVLAGGQSLIPVMNLRMGHPEILVDVCRIPELQKVSVTDEGDLRIGAGVRQATVLTDPRVSDWPMLVTALKHVGHPQIRSRGTVCGSIAHADPAAELPAVALALGATMIARSTKGERKIAADDFFQAPFTTALEESEILTEISLPSPLASSGWAFEEFATRRGDFATAGAAVQLTGADGVVSSCRLALFGVSGTPLRIPEAEVALTGRAVDHDSLAAVVAAVDSGLNPASDIHATGEFRKEHASRLAATTIEKAWERCHD